MPRLSIRPYEERDREGSLLVRSLVYNDGLPIPDERHEPQYSSQYVADLDDEIVGIFNILPMNATRGRALLPCGGVAAVGVAPPHRRGGIGVAMMNWAVEHMRQNGTLLTSLYPFREPFYAKSGYAVVGKRLRITTPVHRLPRTGVELPIRRLTPDDWRSISTCYSEFAHQRSGLHIRSELMWKRVLNEAKPLAIYALGDPIEAYAAVSHEMRFWNEQWISELVWSTPRGYRALLGFLAQLGINKSSLAWYEPSDGPFYAQYLDQGVEVRIERAVMFRVCDVPGALASLKPETSGELVVGITDTQLIDNCGPWSIWWSDGKVEVSKCQGPAELTLDISAFSQAFMGDPSVFDLARDGKIESNDPRAILSLADLLPASPVFCMDFF